MSEEALKFENNYLRAGNSIRDAFAWAQSITAQAEYEGTISEIFDYALKEAGLHTEQISQLFDEALSKGNKMTKEQSPEDNYEKMFGSLIAAFDWALSQEDETGGEEQAETIGEIYGYACEYDLPTHLIDQAYDIASIEDN